MEKIKTAIRWIMVSSADASKWSASVKFALLGAVPFVMQAIGLACGLEIACVSVTGDELQTVALSVSNIVFLALSTVSAVGTLYGIVRKIYRTIDGTNLTLAPYWRE